MTSYQPGIPTGTVNLDQDYANIQGNFGQLNTTYAVNHVPLTQVSNNGYHTIVNMVANTTTAGNPPNNYPPTPPPAVGLTGELYTTQSNDGIITDEILWYQSGGGRVSQLTRNFIPTASQNGATFFPGGLVLQYGVQNTNFASKTGSIVFPMVMPANLYNVQLTLKGTSGTAQTIEVTTFDLNTPNPGYKGFSWMFTGPSGTSYTGFYWTAIGN
jgi:hypothetical protein